MKIKTKLNLGVGLLFVMIMILAITSSFYVFSIKKDTQNILQANYITLEYSRNMLNALDHLNEAQSVAFFEGNLKQQLANITEKGEDKPTLALEQNFMRLKANPVDESLKSQIRRNIFEIMKLNMNAIKQKSDIANQTAETGNIWIAVTGTFCFLIAFNLLINLPNNIANPIRELSSSIRQIANRNYSERVNFGNQNEFGDLARSFNTMAEKLEEYHNSNLYKLSFEKKRLETLINNMNDPIIGLDNEGVILFVNDEALRIMGLKSDEAIGRQAAELAQRNDLLKSLIVNSLESDKPHPMKIFANGKESYFEKEVVTITIKPTGEEQTITIGEVIILRNITVFKELDFAKTHFIATVSHELKTPISSIKLGLQLLENKQTGAINPEQQQLIDGIKDDSQRLLKITGELLELSQLETGNIQLTMEKTPPSDIVRYAVEAVKVQAEQKRIRLVVDCSPDLPEVKADTEKTAWVMINFLTNALRYSP
ncbi:MAG: PAS domain-containing sensor histidine kinase, partial [Flavobacterium sp. BFFFF1]|uniref:sensor histidine kinase n=1 Tax=Flavobacterium sp. BFFFF1 TaxID=2015557 RepID=UPI000BC96D4E